MRKNHLMVFSPKGVDYETLVRNLTLTATTSGYFKADAFKYVDISLAAASKYWLNNNDLLKQSERPENGITISK